MKALVIGGPAAGSYISKDILRKYVVVPYFPRSQDYLSEFTIGGEPISEMKEDAKYKLVTWFWSDGQASIYIPLDWTPEDVWIELTEAYVKANEQ